MELLEIALLALGYGVATGIFLIRSAQIRHP